MVGRYPRFPTGIALPGAAEVSPRSEFADRGNVTKADFGRFNVTGREEDRYVFKVPSLRLAVLTRPYFHDGSARTLADAVRVMARYPLGRLLPDGDVHDIVAFLGILPGEYDGRPLDPAQGR